MDVQCPKCGEPWDVFSFHDVLADMPAGELDGAAWSGLRRDFFRRGCGAAFEAAGWSSGPCAATADPATSSVVSALADVLGDDIDGLASELEDARALGYIR